MISDADLTGTAVSDLTQRFEFGTCLFGDVRTVDDDNTFRIVTVSDTMQIIRFDLLFLLIIQSIQISRKPVDCFLERDLLIQIPSDLGQQTAS